MALILTVDPSYDIAQIILRLVKANVEVSAVIPMLSLISVNASADDIAAAGIIPGVIAIENESDVQIRYDQPFDDSAVIRHNRSSLLDSDLDNGFTARTIN
jgi:hypothetical protein